MLDITSAFNYLTTLIRSYLTSYSSRLKVDGRLSEPFDIKRGSELLYFIRAYIANISTLTLDSSVIVPTQEAYMLSSPKLSSLYSISTSPTALPAPSSSSRLIALQQAFEPRTPGSPSVSSPAIALASESPLLLGLRPGPLLLDSPPPPSRRRYPLLY
ncbi:hypothetical protein L249_3348 [Ophiocordyceps polyrhachis-furcata BCC 54312]|uniref:Uncharacterized protein n=1 Tax=Ophiocordyceps polyrhachis-furcata BCC 54312 TaxID=1330021 RepID=A0A367KYX1_9HYPO|nr:hypothetical protein L249_3348 [Ophiocordyceps polyrhachis-furcata BCC 54312]